MKSTVHTALRLPLRAWYEIATIATIALLVEVGLHVLSLPRLARWVGVPLTPTPDVNLGFGPPDLPSWAIRRMDLIGRVMRHWPLDASCLRRSLVAGQRLRSLHPSLVVGVALVDNEVRAHAWLTIDGVSLDPSGAATFSALGQVPG